MPTETDAATYSALDRGMTHGPGAIAAARATDPVVMGWMQGSPPPADRLVRMGDGSAWAFPQLRWSLSNFARLTPMAEAERGAMPVRPFPVALRADLETITFTPLADSGFDGPIRFDDALFANFTDAIVIVHKGVIVYERHFGVTRPDTRHLLFSVSKSFVGTVAAILVADGRLDPDALVGALVPELAGSGFGDATLRQVMDMTTALAYSEDYTSPTADIAKLVAAVGLAPNAHAAAAAGLRAYLPTIARAGNHGDVFAYRTCNTEVMAWIVHRVTGTSLTDLVCDMIWRKLGAEQSALFVIDGHGSEFSGGGMNAGLRDLARFGEMMRLGGSIDGVEIVPRGVIDDIRRGGNPAAFAPAGYATLPGWSYRNQWWVSHDSHGCYTARGVRGQMIWIDPIAEMTIVRFGSHPLAANGQFDPTSLPGWTAVAKHLMATG